MQVTQHLTLKKWTIGRKLRFSFSFLVVNLRMSIVLQENFSARFLWA